MDRSGDNLVLYDDGHGYCFACGHYQPTTSVSATRVLTNVTASCLLTSDQEDGTIVLLGKKKDTTLSNNLDYVAFRGTTVATAKTYDVKSTIVDGIATDRQYKYGETKTKVRVLGPTKQFYIRGSKDTTAYPLFGMTLFSAGEAKAITITEGEEDAVAAFQMLGSKYPCVSVESASQALGNCRAAYDYLNAFEKIYLCFDNDEPGKKAALEVSSLFDPNKVFIVSLTKYKDASDYLQKGEEKQFISCWWNAKKFTPKGMLASYSDIDEVVRKEDKGTVAHYPFSTLDEKTYGIRYGEYILFMAQEKIGKGLHVDTPLPTPDGWTTVDELQVGDKLFGADGKQVTVTYVTPVQTRPYYRVSFQDGTAILADDVHRWTVRDLNSKVSVVNTQHMVDTGVLSSGSKARYMVPCMQAIQMPEADLPIDPYILGAWLADGHSYSAYITLSQTKLDKMKGYTVRGVYEYEDKCPNYMFEELTYKQLSSCGLLKNKHIPTIYLRSSIEQRQKLMDGMLFDGWKNEFYTSRPIIKDHFLELARSLGYTCKVRVRDGAYTVRFKKKEWKAIRSIEPIGEMQGRCLTVDHPDHLFAAGAGWTMTHNTEVFRAIEHHLLKTTNERIGLIHLEDTDKRTVQGIVTYESGIPCHLPDRKLSPDEMLEYYKSATGGDENRVQIYSHFGSDDPNTILDVLRYLVKTCGCKFIFLDHITMLVTGFEDDDERKKLDYLSTKLAMLVKELDFTLFLITHVNDEGKARGSRNITKVCDISVRMERDKENDDANIRNTTRLSVVDNRFCGHTGFAGNLFFDPDTYTLSEKEKNYAEEANSMGL